MATRDLGACLALLPAAMSASAQEVSLAARGIAADALREEVIAELTPGGNAEWIASYRRRVVWIEEKDKTRSVWLDGQRHGGVYENVQHIALSRDENHLAFAGKRVRGGWVAVVDGREQPVEFDSISGFAFGASGGSPAFTACRAQQCSLFMDGEQPDAVYEAISAPQYSPDGSRLAYIGRRAEQWFAVVDGEELGPALDAVAWGAWGFDGSGTRFYVGGSRLAGYSWEYVVDGTPGPAFTAVSSIVFSADGARYAYSGAQGALQGAAKRKVQGALVVDGVVENTYDGSAFGQWWKGFWQAFLSVEERMRPGLFYFTPSIHGLSAPAFNANGEVVYAAARGENSVAVFVGNQEGPRFDAVIGPLSRAHNHVAYVARRGNELVEVHDHVPGAGYLPEKAGFVGFIAVDCSGSRIAYLTQSAREGVRARRRVIVDGHAEPEYQARDIWEFAFSRDGNHYWYAVHGAERSRGRVVIDGRETRLYDDIVYNSLFETAGDYAHGGTAEPEADLSDCNAAVPSGPTVVRFIARDGRRLVRVSYAFSPITTQRNLYRIPVP